MLNAQFEIGGKIIANGAAPYVIAEAGSNHNQDMDTALRLIDAAAEAGADAVKFQLFLAEKLYPGGGKMHDIFKSIELNREWLPKLSEHCAKRGVHFLASPFDLESVDLLVKIGSPAFKVASSETTSVGLLGHMATQKLPMIVSTAMCDLVDVYDAAQICLRAGNADVALLQCGAMYPLPPEHVNLRVMDTFRDLFRCPVGFSDHTLGLAAGVAAVGRGACIVEKHFTLSKKADGPDHFYALEPQDLSQFVAMIREAYASLGSEDKVLLPEERAQGRREGLYAARRLNPGETLNPADVSVRRPAGKIRKRHLPTLLGATVTRAIEEGETLSWDAFRI